MQLGGAAPSAFGIHLRSISPRKFTGFHGGWPALPLIVPTRAQASSPPLRGPLPRAPGTKPQRRDEERPSRPEQRTGWI